MPVIGILLAIGFIYAGIDFFGEIYSRMPTKSVAVMLILVCLMPVFIGIKNVLFNPSDDTRKSDSEFLGYAILFVFILMIVSMLFDR